jgi:endonuclease I
MHFIRLAALACFLTTSVYSSLWAQAVLPTAWNFSTPPVSSPPTGWTFGIGLNGTGGLTYTGASFSVGGDNISARFDATGEFVKISFAEAPGRLTYYIKGTGIGAVSFTGTFHIQESPDDVNYTNLRTFTTANPIPGGNLSANKFTDNPASTSRFIRFFYTDKQPNSNVALDSVLVRAAPPSAGPSLTIKVGTTTLVNNSQYTVGTAGSTIFTLQNNGTGQNLTIDSVRFSGPAAGDYVLPSIPATVAPLSSQSLDLQFAASQSGSRKATMRVYNSDPTKNPYVIQLYGIGGTVATEPSEPVQALNASDVKSFSARLSLVPPAQAPEKYLILRRKGAAITDFPADGQTYKQGDLVGSAMVAYVGDSAVTNLVPRYMFASSSYHFTAIPFNGPAGFENYLNTNPTATIVTTPGKQPGTYYDGINPALPTFVTDLKNKINPHDTIFYSAYAPRLISTWLERDTTLGRKVVNCVYTNIPYIYEGSFNYWTGQGSNPATLTREHSYAQSWMPSNTGGNWPEGPNGKEYPEFNDMHNLFPAHQANANSRRSNNPLGIVVNATYTSPTGMGKLGTNSGGQTVYEPRDEHKGDAARALMYMATCYHRATPANLNWSFPSNQSPAVMMQWHQNDPPSDLEVARHELIFSLQKNRNPFIDFPEWASQINFGTMAYLPVSNQPFEFHHSVATWPNPATDGLMVDATLIFDPFMTYSWIDALGKTVSSGQLYAEISKISVPSKKGIYFLQLHGKKGNHITRVVRD